MTMEHAPYHNLLDENNLLGEVAGRIGELADEGVISEEEADVWKFHLRGLTEADMENVRVDVERYNLGAVVVIQHHQAKKFGLEISALETVVLPYFAEHPEFNDMDMMERTEEALSVIYEKIDHWLI